MSYSPMPPSPYAPGPVAAPTPPPAMRRAVGLMWAGGVLSVIYGIVAGAVVHSVLMANSSSTTTSTGTVVTAAVIGGVIQAGLWAWMAWKTSAGRNWARILSTVFFGILCIDFIAALAAGAGALKIIIAVQWIVGLSALILLWQRESSAFFDAAKQAVS